MKVLIITVFTLFISQLHAQIFEWAAQMGGTNYEKPYDVLVDETDNSIYLVGMFYDDFDADPAGGSSVTAINSYDAMLVKISSNGDLEWANHIGGTDNETATKITIDDQQNVIMVVNNTPNVDVYKFDGNNGSLLWYYSSDYASQANGYGVTIDSQNDIYITGTYSDTVDFDNSSNADTLIAEGNEDGFVLKLSADGNYLWAKSFGNMFGGALFRDIEWHFDNQLYISGFFHGQVDFDPSSATNYLNAIGSTDAFALRLDTAGSFVWAKQMGGPSSIQCNGLTIDDQGDLIMTGAYQGTIELDPNSTSATHSDEGGGDFYVHKLDTNGNFVWGTSIGGTAYETADGISTDDNGNTYVTGSFNDVVDFDPSSGQSLLDAGMGGDAFLLKLDSNGDFVWAVPVSGNAYNSGVDVTVDANNQVLFTGTFTDTSDLDPTVATEQHIAQGADWFLIKIDPTYTVSLNKAAKQQMAVYPNPTTGPVTITSPINGELKVYSLTGCLVESMNITKGQQQLNLQHKSGLYLLEISNGESSIRRKVQLY